jgi:S1/P1 Nuclease.
MNLKGRIFQIVIITLVLFANAFPWGKVGHQTIGYIAQANLSPATIEKLKPLLQGESLADISTWADDIKRRKRSTGVWHYIDLPIRENITEQDIPRFYSKHGHVDGNLVSQVKKEIAELRSGHGSLQDRQETLKFLVHFIEDAHMPLHCADDNDAGGNDKQVRFFAPNSRSGRGHLDNLHSLWDNLIEVKAMEDPTELAERLNREFNASQKQKWTTGSIDDWVWESYSIAKNRIYPGFLAGPVSAFGLPRNYFNEMRPVVDEQLEKAGVRLARLLEEVVEN